VTRDDPTPPNPGLLDLVRQGGRWWMWLLIAAVGLSLVALVVLQALEYVAPYIYVAI